MTGWRDGFIRCFNRANGAVEWEVANAHRGAITAIYADANYILSGGEEGAVRVWARSNRKLLIQFNGKYKNIAFSSLTTTFSIYRSKESYRQPFSRFEQATYGSFMLIRQNHLNL